MLGVYPKSDGEIYYGLDANMAYYQSAYGTVLNHASVDVNNSATLIKASNTARKCILIKNNGTSTLYIGTTNAVTIADGYPIEASESIYFYFKDAVYGITASATIDIRYMEVE